MKVELINYTADALEVLLFTKQTRLTLSAGLMEEIKGWSTEKKMAELDYMLGTIQSSWEFIDYMFLISGVSRAFTHQLVRHRHASYAQQAQRAVNMSEFEYITGPSIENESELKDIYMHTMGDIAVGYQRLLDKGANRQDARGVLPTNICTNIVMKTNLRSLHDIMLKRLCVKAQGEAQDVFRLIREEVIKIHPWADKFLKVWCAFHGTCCFPTFPTEQCPVKPYVYDPQQGAAYNGHKAIPLPDLQQHWDKNRAEAQPIVKE